MNYIFQSSMHRAYHRTLMLMMIALTAVATQLTFAPNVAAHAAFKTVSPADGELLESPPTSIVVEFTKDIDTNVREAALLPPTGDAIDDAWSADGARITIEPPAKMADGTWSVKWRVLGGDGHPLTGSSTFSIRASTPVSGDARNAREMVSAYPQVGLERLALAGRILFFGGLLLFVGGVIFAIVAAPGWRPRFWNATLAAVVVGAWIVLGTYVAILDERSLLEMLNPAPWFSGMLSTACRGYVLATVIVLLVHAFRFHLEPVEWEGRGEAHPKLLIGLVMAAAASPSLSGHAADGTFLWIRIPFDMLHVLAGAAWIGGLVQMMTIVVRERSLDPRMTMVVNRYSWVAAASVGVLVVTGTYATLNELDAGVGDLIGSTWGRLVLLKVLLLLATMPLANVNRLRNVPEIGDDPVRGVPRLRRFVALELIIIIWVVVATALLVYETPPTSAAPVQPAAGTEPVTSPEAALPSADTAAQAPPPS